MAAQRTALLIGPSESHDPGERALRQAVAAALEGWTLTAAVSDPADVAEAEGLRTVGVDSPRALAAETSRARLVVGVGNAAFRRVEGRRAQSAALLAAAAAPTKKLALLGVSAEPAERLGERLLVRTLLGAADLCVVSDRRSAGSMLDAGAQAPLRIGADPAWSTLAGRFDAPAITRVNGDRRRAKIIVAFDHRRAGRDPSLRVAAALAPLAHSGGFSIDLHPWLVRPSGVDDVEAAQSVATTLGDAARLTIPPADLLAARELYASADVVVAMGHRTLIAAAAAGTRCATISDDPTTRALAQRLLQPAASTESAAEMTATITAALEGGPPPADAVRAEIDAAEEAFRLLRVLVAEGRTTESEEVRGLSLEPEPGSGAGRSPSAGRSRGLVAVRAAPCASRRSSPPARSRPGSATSPSPSPARGSSSRGRSPPSRSSSRSTC